MSIEKPSKGEHEVIQREEQREIAKKKAQDSAEKKRHAREEERALHHGKCPQCGVDLESELFYGLDIDRCGECRGVWLDKDSLEKLAGKESKILQDVFDFFKRVGESKPISDM